MDELQALESCAGPRNEARMLYNWSILLKIYHTKLFDVSKSLELWGVNDFPKQWLKYNMPMDGIIEHLCKN